MGTRVGQTAGMMGLLVAAWLFLAGPAAVGQSATAPASDTKPRTFDVVSIKPNNSGVQHGSWGLSLNRFSVKNMPLAQIILESYLGGYPSTDRLKGAPGWVMSEPYDLTAKVDDATADEWRGLKQAQQFTMAAPMLLAMLEDRCKLVAHTEPTTIEGYALTVAKHGIKMKLAQPDEPVPTGAVKFGSGWMVPIQPKPDAKQSVIFVQITMEEFATSFFRDPVVDETRLTGKYDFELPKFDMTLPEAGNDSAPPSSVPDIEHMFDWKAVGLEMKATKVPAENVVIDHIEKPSAN
jgi:uncharacterized protein (TIGR03435 family)